MTTSLSSALDVRGIPLAVSQLTAEVETERDTFERSPDVETRASRAGVPAHKLGRITVKYKLNVPPDKRAAAERALQFHHKACAVYQSIEHGVKVEWSWEIREP